MFLQLIRQRSRSYARSALNLSILERGVWNNLKYVGCGVLGVRRENRLQLLVLVLVILVLVVGVVLLVVLVVLALVAGGRGQTGLLGDPGLPRRIHT